MKHVLRALAAIAALTMSASASADPVIKPVLKAPIAVKATIQPDIARKLDLLKGAGVLAVPDAVKTPVTLSVQQPVKDAYTNLTFTGIVSYDPLRARMTLKGSQPHDAVTGGRGPFGSIIPSVPEINLSTVVISFRAAAGFRYILDCKVSGAEEYRFAEFTNAEATAWRSTRVRPVDGRVTLLMLTPREGAGKKAFVTGFSTDWNWESCEITPVG